MSDHFDQFCFEPLTCPRDRVRRDAGRAVERHRQRRHVLPDDQAQRVGPVVPARRLDLDVFADEGEAQLFRLLEIEAQGVVGGRGRDAVRPVALVERAVQERGPAVERDPGAAVVVREQTDRAETGVAADLVQNRAMPVTQLDPQCVEVRVVGCPEAWFGNVHTHRRPGRAGAAGDLAVCGRNDDTDLGTADDLREHGHAGEVRRQLKSFDTGFGHRLEPHRLPDSGRRRVADPAGRVALLADREGLDVGAVLGPDGQLLRPRRPQHVGDVRAERRVAAFVRRDELVVDPHLRRLVDGAEVQEDPLAGPIGRDLDQAPVPEDLVASADSGQRRLRRERNQDPLGVARRPWFVRRRRPARVLPDAVEIEPARPGQLGPRDTRAGRCPGRPRRSTEWPGAGRAGASRCPLLKSSPPMVAEIARPASESDHIPK